MLGAGLYWNGFQQLSTCRQLGFGGEGPIPWTAVRLYCEHLQLTPDEVDDFESIIESLDHKYLEMSAEKAKKK